MNLEQSASRLNSLYFLEEFTFSNATFKPNAETQLELADGIIWLDETAVVFQMKERSAAGRTTESSEEGWFKKKVLRDATKQIRDTIKYLDNNASITAKNSRGQAVTLEGGKLKTLHKVVLYSEPNRAVSRDTHYISSTAGFIHLMPLTDYEGVVRTLCTPPELFEYLAWREHLLKTWESCSRLPEQAMLGHYLWGNLDKTPSLDDVDYLYAIKQDIESFDLTGILHKFLDRTYENFGPEGTEYHRIIREVAKLNRVGLRSFKERFKRSMDKAKEGTSTLPYRFSIPANDCGFVFIPLEEEFRNERRRALFNLTEAAKYDQHLSKYVGIVFLADPDGWFTIDWCIIDAPWLENPTMEALLKDSYPFRQLKSGIVNRYKFSRWSSQD